MIRQGAGRIDSRPDEIPTYCRIFEARPAGRPEVPHRKPGPAFLTVIECLLAEVFAGIHDRLVKPSFHFFRDLIADLELSSRPTSEISGMPTAERGEEPDREAVAEKSFALSEAVELIQKHGGRILFEARSLESPTGIEVTELTRCTKPVHSADYAWEKIRNLERLPAAPDNVLAILQYVNDDRLSWDQIVPHIECDPALTAAILKYTNAPFFGLRNKIAHLRQAVSLIGPASVTTLALGMALRMHEVPRCEAFDYGRFWSRSVACAVNTRRMAKLLNVGNSEVAFTAGLLCEIGSLALATAYPTAYGELLADTRGHDSEWLMSQEIEHFGLDHHQAAARLLAEWGLPEAMCEAIELSTRPQVLSGGSSTCTLADILYWAATTSMVFTMDEIESRPAGARKSRHLADRMGVEAPVFAAVFNEAIGDWRDAGRILDVKTAEVPSWPGILEEVPRV